MFRHLDLRAEARTLESLLSDAAAVAFHADADGFCSGFFCSRLTPDFRPPMFQVFTEDLDLLPLCGWIEEHDVHGVVTFDVNVLSASGALARLAECTKGRLRIYDDHIGAPSQVPVNAEFVELLPATPEGTWTGVLEASGGPLRLTITLTNGPDGLATGTFQQRLRKPRW